MQCGTQTLTLPTIRCLSDPIRTLIVDPPFGLQRQSGSHANVILMPTLRLGHTVASSIVVTTGSLREPGVILPDFVSREFLNGALKAVEDHNHAAQAAPTTSTHVTSEEFGAFKSEGVKRRHDQDDDHHDHEGENAKGQRFSEAMGSEYVHVDTSGDNVDKDLK
ncbi:hypothetical protein L6452_15057 [Arctium lappa]|uniref:Uncharacterized protein n=1 Tax=Arctium lappa TaxID=4217 RepID=A0ACB9CMU1_ARCLA|nr:hypothetical protein L6452_15057 [Arctium lappa]